MSCQQGGLGIVRRIEDDRLGFRGECDHWAVLMAVVTDMGDDMDTSRCCEMHWLEGRGFAPTRVGSRGGGEIDPFWGRLIRWGIGLGGAASHRETDESLVRLGKQCSATPLWLFRLEQRLLLLLDTPGCICNFGCWGSYGAWALSIIREISNLNAPNSLWKNFVNSLFNMMGYDLISDPNGSKKQKRCELESNLFEPHSRLSSCKKYETTHKKVAHRMLTVVLELPRYTGSMQYAVLEGISVRQWQMTVWLSIQFVRIHLRWLS
jgi:hypothetical protein